MVQAQVSPAESDAIEARPTCPECGVLMWLIRVERIGPHTDRHVFECPACEVVVEHR